MKRWAWLLTIILGITVLIIFGYMIKEPPLKSYGFSTYTIPGNELKHSIEVVNNGIEKVKIKEVLVNGNQEPDHTAIGVGNRLVLGDIENSNDFSFHSFKDIAILPLKEVRGRDRILLNYGVVIWNEDAVNSVEIQYTYLGIPYSLIVETATED